MFTILYLASFGFGGVLLAGSLLLGGHDDATGDEPPSDLKPDLAHASDSFWVIKSLRFWIFFLAFFGMTGLAVSALGLIASELWAFVLASTVGLAAGFGAAAVLRAVSQTSAENTEPYVGKTGRLLVESSATTLGKVRVEVMGTSVDLLATSDENLSTNEEVVIVEMDGTRARVARLESPNE